MRLILFATLLMFAACNQKKNQEKQSAPTDYTASSEVQQQIKVEDIAKHLNYLASDEMKGRDTGSPEIERAAAYISTHFSENGVQPYFSSYYDTLQNYDGLAYNVVGLVPSQNKESNEFILIGAHFDHIGVMKPLENSTDSIGNGANDNATGTTVVMELARYFGANPPQERSLIFALFSAEEKGLRGSKHLAQKLKSEDMNLPLMLNFEMMGIPMNHYDYSTYVTGYNKSNLAELVNEVAQKPLAGFLETAESFNLFRRSDNAPFYDEFGIPAHTFSSFDFTNFDFYHKAGDEPSLMNPEFMTEMTNEFIPVIESFANRSELAVKMN
ncbi:MAG: M28 family metallopeptidase [Flavobacteriaceae bacterium]